MAIAGAVHVEPSPATSHKWFIALAVMLGTTLEVVDSSIINVALPHLQGAFSAGVDEIAWVVTSYLVANGIMIPMTGWISARVGRKRYFLASIFVFVVASVLCGTAQSLMQIVIFRLVQGTAGAAMVPSSQAILVVRIRYGARMHAYQSGYRSPEEWSNPQRVIYYRDNFVLASTFDGPSMELIRAYLEREKNPSN